MLAVEPNSFEMREPPTLQSSEHVEEPEISVQKQVSKRPLITPFRIMLGLAIFFLLIVGTFKVYSMISPPSVKSGIEATNQNIRTHADSSSQNGKGSSTGSSSSRGGRNSDKPREASKPAGKDVIANTNNMNGDDGGE